MNAPNTALTSGFDHLLNNIIIQIINPIIMLVSAGAFIVFIWGVFKYVKNAEDETERAEGRRGMIWGIIGLAIMFGAYGILNIATATFGLAPVQPLTH